jgi:hypothetical protein
VQEEQWLEQVWAAAQSSAAPAESALPVARQPKQPVPSALLELSARV